MNRFQKILAGLLILQLLIAIAVFWPQNNVQASDEPLLAEFNTDEVTAVTIEDGNGTVLELAREGDEWVLASGGNYPVDRSIVETFLNKLAAAKTNRLVTQTEASHPRLQIAADNFVRHIGLTLADGSTRSVYMGTSANAQATHLRPAGQDAVYLVGDITAQDASPTAGNWIDTSYVTLPREEITAVTLENENGSFEFTKSTGGE